MTLITTFIMARFQELYHHLFLPLLPHFHLFLTTHFTLFSLTFQVLLTALSFCLLPFDDVAASLSLLYVFNHTVPFALSSTLSFLFPLELYQGEVEFAVSCYNVGLLAAGICVEGLKSLIRRIYSGAHLLYSSAIEAAQDVWKLWVKADVVERIKVCREWVGKNVVRVEFVWGETIAVAEDSPIEAEPGAEAVVVRVILPPLVEIRKPPPVKERPPLRCPSPFKSSSRSSFSERQKSDLYRKSSDYYNRHDLSKNCLTVVNRTSIWNIPAGRGRSRVPVVSCAAGAAKPIIDIVTPESMIKKTENMASMEKSVTDQKSRKELARRSENAAIESLEGVEKLPVESRIVDNIAIGYMPAEYTREDVIAQTKEEGEVKDPEAKEEKEERGEDAVEQVLSKEEEPIQTRGTTGLQKSETQKHSTPQTEVREAIITDCGIKITGRLIMPAKEPEKTNTEAKWDGGFVMEGKAVLFNNPTPGVLGPTTALPGVTISTVSEAATTTSTPLAPEALGGDTIAGSSTIVDVTSVPGVTAAAALSVSEVLNRDNVTEISEYPIVEVARPVCSIEVLAPAWACDIVEGIQPSVLTPELFGALYSAGFDHVTHIQDVSSPIHIVEDESLEDTAVEMEQCEELDLEVIGDKDEEMIDGWDGQAVGDEEMNEVPFNPQMMDKAQLSHEDHRDQKDTMDDISYTSDNCEYQEMEIEESGLEIIFSQEMEIDEMGLEVTSSQEMEIEETVLEAIPIESVSIGTAQHQSFFVAPFMVTPACYSPSVSIHDIFLEPIPIPAPVFASGVSDPLSACRIVSDLTSGSITHTAASPTPTCSIPLPDLAAVRSAPALALDVSGLGSILAIPGDIQMPAASVSTGAPTINPVSTFLLASAVTAENTPTLPKNQQSEIATTFSSSSRTFQRHHESVTVTTAATDETPTPIKDGEVTGLKVPGNILKTQYEIIAIETQAPAAVETATTVEAFAAVETPALVETLGKEITTPSPQTPPPIRYQTATPSTLTSYTSPRHVETSTASSSRVPTPKRQFEPDANSRRDTPGPKKVARTIAPLKKSRHPIAPTKPINVPAKPPKGVKGEGKGKGKVIEIEETWSDNDEDAFDDMGIDALRDISAEEKRIRRDYNTKSRGD
ncbi:hypothetical protein DFP73DRAFT_531426 [Morchella snyderi]|nr:hypothetical protein DFP73DRAFT_531426 [Morchella snyderi]